MTVHELITELQKHYAHTKVLISVRGEDGMQDYVDVKNVGEMLVRRGAKTEVSIVLF
jgi:hypothetical protein